MMRQNCLYVIWLLTLIAQRGCIVSSGGAPGDTVILGNRYAEQTASAGSGNIPTPQPTAVSPSPASAALYHAGSGHMEHRSSYNLLSEAMSQAVSNEFMLKIASPRITGSSGSGSADGACHADDMECYTMQDRLGMEAIRSLHRQLDDDDNGNIDLSESDDFLREELKYDSGYEKRQKAFHFNDDMHISVKELWEAWLRSEVHNWTIEQTTDWLAQSVQLPQYVELFKQHKVTGAALPRLAVNNMHYVSNVLGIKDPIHKQKIALKAMDVVLFGPPRETGTRWKDYILVTLLLSAIIGCWYAYQQNKNAKRHLRRMAQDMEGLQRAEQSLQEMQKELERARMEQENVATEKMDLERRLKEAPALSSSSSDLEVQQLKKEIEMLRNELSRAEIELVDNCWAPPPQLQSWLQYTYELESKNHLKKRVSAEKQLQSAREACEKLRKKRSSLVGAFVSTHGKSIDDVDRSIVEARNSLGEVTNELQERLHRWKQIESCLGFNIVNNNGLPYLESVLYGRNGASMKGSRARITSSTDDLDDESVQGIMDSYSRSTLSGSVPAASSLNTLRDDSSGSEDGGVGITASPASSAGIYDGSSTGVHFYLGNTPTTPTTPSRALVNPLDSSHHNHVGITTSAATTTNAPQTPANIATAPALALAHYSLNDSHICDESSRHSPSVSSVGSERSIAVPPRSKKQQKTLIMQQPQIVTTETTNTTTTTTNTTNAVRAPLPPPRKANQSEMLRSQSADLLPMEIYGFLSRQSVATPQQQQQQLQQQQQQHTNYIIGNSNNSHTPCQTFFIGSSGGSGSSASGGIGGTAKKMVKQLSNASQQSTSSTSSSVQSAPAAHSNADGKGHSPARWCGGIYPTQHSISIQQQSKQQSKQQQFRQSLQQSHNISTSLQSIVANAPTASITTAVVVAVATTTTAANSVSATTTSAATIATSHSDTAMEDAHAGRPIRASSVDNVSLDGSSKKRKRRLRFPFSVGRKSGNNSVASASVSSESGTSLKNKFA